MHIRIVLAMLALLLITSCARDVTGELDEAPYPNEVTMVFKTKGNFTSDYFYFLVFNFSQAPEPPATSASATTPSPTISGEDRGRNWELYVMYHDNPTLGPQFVTLQRPNEPTVLGTGDMPADTAGHDLNGDGNIDIVVACKGSDTVEIIHGQREFDIYDPIYFESPQQIEAAAGTAPIRLLTFHLVGTEDDDLLVLYAGDGTGGTLRTLENDGAGVFAASLTDVAIPGTPVDWVFEDFDSNQVPDLAILTEDAGAGSVQILTGSVMNDGEGNEWVEFAITGELAVGANPRELRVGSILGTGSDLIVVDDGGDSGSGTIYLFQSNGDMTFADPATIEVPGTVTSVDTGRLFGQTDDLLYSYIDNGQGYIAMIDNEPETGLTAEPKVLEFWGQPQQVVLAKTNNDNHLDVLIVDGLPGSENQNFFVLRSTRTTPDEQGAAEQFAWEDLDIRYKTGVEPSRITMVDLDADGQEDDLLIPNSANVDGGNSINLFFHLGDTNYTNADVYWTDDPPLQVTSQEWYLSHRIGPNFIELVIDPALFYDLARVAPDSFIVDFMTATSAIDFESNREQLGEVYESLSPVLVVPMTVDHYDDEQLTPRALEIAPTDAADIDDWIIEVL